MNKLSKITTSLFFCESSYHKKTKNLEHCFEKKTLPIYKDTTHLFVFRFFLEKQGAHIYKIMPLRTF